MKPVIAIICSPQFLCLLFQGEKFQISEIILQIIAGFLYEIFIDCLYICMLAKSQIFKKPSDLLRSSSIIMNGNIHVGIQAQMQVAVQPAGLNVSRSFFILCQLCGIAIG